MNVGQRIRGAREELGMQGAVLARRVGVAPNTIYRYESGEREPSVAMLAKIARELRTEPAEFLREPVPFSEAPREAGRRADVYEPWAEFVNRFAERWEQKIAGGVLDHGSVMEFTDVLGDLWPVLSRLEREEKQEQPAEYPNTLGPVAGAAMNRLLALFNPLIAAGAKQEEDSVFLARLRRQREQMVGEQELAN